MSKLLTRSLVLAGVSAVALAGAAGLMAGESTSKPAALAVVANNIVGQAEDGYADLAAQVLPAVVNVRVTGEEKTADGQGQGTPFDNPNMRDFFERFFGQPMPSPEQMPHRQVHGEGSGFFIDADGHIVTNAHVAGGADKIEVVTQSGETLPAKLVGIDTKTDLAVLKVEAGKPTPYVVFADSSKARVGSRVIAVGNPFGLGGTVTSGIISATGRELGNGPYDDFLQIDASINRGNSGGPAFNLRGEVVGINSMIFSPSGGSVGIGFAIASNLAKQVVADLIDDGKVERGWLGVGIQGIDKDLADALHVESTDGVIVASVMDGSPAAKAGLKTGDVVVAIDGHPMTKVRDVTRAVAGILPGKQAEIEVLRDGKPTTVAVAIGAMPTDTTIVAAADAAEVQHAKLGITLADLSANDLAQFHLDHGVGVAGVQPDSVADQKGLRRGDVILEVGGRKVASAKDVVEAVQSAESHGGKSVLMLVQREDAKLFLALPMATS